MCEELSHTTREEGLCDIGREEKVKDQVSNFLSCLKLLIDPDATRKLVHMLTNCMGEEGMTVAIFSPLLERGVCQVNK